MSSPSAPGMGQPLAGVVVFDFTRHLSGPFCTTILRDLGARVVKFEPEEGDPARRSGPFVGNDSAYFHPINRGKESVKVDLRSESDVERIRSLLTRVDCVVENFRPGVMSAIGLDSAVCLAANPRLVFASVSGFGADGPLSSRPAFDVVVQAMGGVMSVTGQEGGPPTRVGVSQGDIVAGVYTALAILSALVRRQRTGLGGYIDISMLESQLALMTHAIGIRVATGEDPARIGSRHPAVAPFDVFPSQNGFVAIGVADDRGFAALCKALGIPDLLADVRFADAAGRIANVGPLTERIAKRTSELTSERLVELLLEASVPVGPVLGPSDLLSDRHLEERKAFVRIPDWGDDGLVVPTLPFRIDGHRLVTAERAPELGELSLDDLEEEIGDRA